MPWDEGKVPLFLEAFGVEVWVTPEEVEAFYIKQSKAFAESAMLQQEVLKKGRSDFINGLTILLLIAACAVIFL